MLVPLYARDEADAAQRAEQWIKKQRGYVTCISLTAYPLGFHIHRTSLPGTRRIPLATYERMVKEI